MVSINFRYQKGFTLFELFLVMTLTTIVTTAYAPHYSSVLNERRAERDLSNTAHILDAAKQYRAVNGSWPCSDGINTLITDGYLRGVTDTNSFENTVTTSCDGDIFQIIQTTAPGWGEYFAQGIGATEILDASTGQVRTNTGIPGREMSLSALLPHDGSVAWSGSMDAGGNNLTSVGNIYASRYYDQDNTAFYLDPASGSNLNTATLNSVTAAVFYDKDDLSYLLNPASTSLLNRVDVRIIYDSDNTAYYLNPSSSSNVNELRSLTEYSNIYYDRNDTRYYVDANSTSQLENLQLGLSTNSIHQSLTSGGTRDVYLNSSVGGWARGTAFYRKSDYGRMGGYGYLGSGETLTGFRVGSNSSWWSSYDFAVNPSSIELKENTYLDSGKRLYYGSNYITDSGANFLAQTGYGYITFGPANSSWAHFNTDRARFYFGKTVTVDGELQVYNSGSTRTVASSTGKLYDQGVALTSKYAQLSVSNNFSAEQYVNGNRLWHAGNDGASSGLDSDTLDGLSSGSFIRSDASDSVSGHTEWQDTYQIRLGSSADYRMYHDGSNSFQYNYTGNVYHRNSATSGYTYIQTDDSAGSLHTVARFGGPNPHAVLYYDGVSRIVTTNDGIDVNGSILFPNSSTSKLKRVSGISFNDQSSGWNTENYHGITSRDFSGNYADDLSITSYHTMTFTIDSNNNNGTEYFYFRSNAASNGTSIVTIDGSGNTTSLGRFHSDAASGAGGFTVTDPYGGAKMYTTNSNGDFFIAQTNASGSYEEPWILASRNGSVYLYYNGSARQQTYSNGVITYGNQQADRFYDRNNTSYYLDPASTSFLNDVRVNIIYDRNDTSYYINPASTSIVNALRANIFYDRNNTSYYADLDGTSRLNHVSANYITLNNVYTEGSSCSTGQVGRNSTGGLLACVSGTWEAVGGDKAITGGTGVVGWADIGDLRVVWGRHQCGGTGERTFSLAKSFTNTNYSIQASYYSGNRLYDTDQVHPEVATSSSFRIYCSSSTKWITYLAVGRSN